MRRWTTSGIVVVLTLAFWSGLAEAARNFTAAQTPAPNAPVTMGTTGTLTYRITNANTGGNTGERIYEVRFRVGGGGRRGGGGATSTFSSSTAAPAGWTRTSYSTTSVTFRANSWAAAIVTGSYLDFPIIFTFRQTTADTNELLRDIRARYTNSTGGPPFTDLGSDTDSNQGGWTLKALAITLQITDTGGAPITSLIAGSSYRVVMTVTNSSTATLTSIVSVPNPPTQTASFTGAAPSYSSTVYSPNPLTLAAGATGTITFTYTTSPTAYGTVFYTAYARNNSGTATSATAVSPTLYVGLFIATVTVSPSSCLYSGQTFTVQMLLTNNFGYNITGVTPTMTVPLAGTALSLTSGPTPATGTVTGGGGTLPVTWTYQVTATANGETFTFDGAATGTGGGGPRTTSRSSPSTKAGGYSIAVNQTNAASTNDEISWGFQNNGCAATNSVSVNIPAGWSWAGGSEDSYSLVETGVGTSVENTWTVSGSGPVTFTAPTATDRQYVGGQGDYNLAFSSTPTTAGPSVFTVTITDAAGYASAVPTTVTVNPFNFNNLNDSNGLIWQEQVR
ncbi:MAG: hypothetical protein ACOYXU_08360 [Nitrospirota bacterium]